MRWAQSWRRRWQNRDIAVAIYAALARHANPQGTCWPSISGLADILGVTRATVRSRMRVLEQAGFVLASRVYTTDWSYTYIFTLLGPEARPAPERFPARW